MVDTLEKINCPACGKEMFKCFDSEKKINIDVCIDGCGSLFFDNRELEKFDEAHENAEEIFKLLENKTFKLTDTSDVRICAVCRTPMVKIGTGIPNIQIDVCNVCGAKFLDNGELYKIRTTTVKEDKDLPKILNSLYEETVIDMIGQEKFDELESNPRQQFFADVATSIILKFF